MLRVAIATGRIDTADADIGRTVPVWRSLLRRPAFDPTFVATDYAVLVDQMVLAVKFGRQLALAWLFAELLCDALATSAAREIPLSDLLTAVPL